MNCKTIKIILFLFFLPFTAFSQDARLKTEYGDWLKKMQLDKFLEVSEIKYINTGQLRPDSTADHIPQLLLVLKPSSNQADPQNLATSWNYIAGGFQDDGIDLYLLLLNKLANDANCPLDRVRIVCKSSDPKVFSLDFFFDKTLQNQSNVNVTMGNEVSLDFDFSAAEENSVSYSFIVDAGSVDLRKHWPQIDTLFHHFKHEPAKNVRFKVEVSNDDMLKFEVHYLRGAISEGYHERVYLLITAKQTGTRKFRIWYQLGAACASGTNVIPEDNKSYQNIEDELPGKLAAFNKDFSIKFKKIFP